MAELLLQTKPPGHDEDGDCLCAFNRRRIRCCHAEVICHRRKRPKNNAGLNRRGDIQEDIYRFMHQYVFQRVTRHEVRRRDLVTLDEVIFSKVPQLIDGKWQAMDVDLYIQRRVSFINHRIFGLAGSEVWFGGRKDMSHPKLNQVWNRIENSDWLAGEGTPKLEADHTLWPLSPREKARWLSVPVTDFNDARRSQLEQEERSVAQPGDDEYDPSDPDNPDAKLRRMRKRRLRWRLKLAELGVTVEDVVNESLQIDIRQTAAPLDEAVEVETKTPLA